MKLSAITLSMYLIGAVSVSSYPIRGSESEFDPDSSGPAGLDMSISTGSHQTKESKGSALGQTKVGPLKSKESIQGTSKSSAIKGRVEVPPEDSYKPTETTKKQFQWSKLKGKNEPPKGGSLKPKEFTQDQSTWYMDSENDRPKPLKVPQPQKQNNRDITTPKKGFNPASSGPAGLDMSISTGSHQTKESKGSALGQTKVGPLKSKESIQGTSKSSAIKGRVEVPSEDSYKSKGAAQKQFQWSKLKGKNEPPKGGSLEPKEFTQDQSTWYAGSDDDRPKPLKVPQPQKQNNEVIKTPKKGLNSDSSGPAGLDMSISTGSHQTKESKGSALGQTKVGPLKSKESIQGTSKSSAIKGRVEVPPEDSYKPTETTKKQFQWSKLKGKNEPPKGGSLEPKEFTQDQSTWYAGSDDDRPKPLKVPQPQKQNNEVIKTPKKGFNPASSGPAGLDMSISTGSHQTKESKGSALGQTKEDSLEPEESAKSSSKSSAIKGRVEVPPEDSYKPTETTKKPFQWSKLKGNNGSSKGGSLKPTKTTQGSSKSSSVSGDDGPKKTQDPPTQKQNNEVITAPKVGSNRGSSSSTGAAAVPNGAIDTGSHQTKDNNKSALGQAKGADSSIPNSLALESTNPDLPGQLIDSQEKKKPIPNPTPSESTPEVASVREFLALGDSGVSLKNRQAGALKLFLHLNKPVKRNENLYTLQVIETPEKEKIEQGNMMTYFESTYKIKKKNQKLLTCERDIFSFPTTGPSLASKYFEAKKSQTKSQTKAIEKRALTDEEEGEYLIHLCLTARGKLLSAQSESRQTWLELTEDQKKFYQYLKPVTTHMIFQLAKSTTASQ
ncbi:hypothetical protein BASA50_004855 [Batrachochytrium salamandrivorans]|uniref:Uncharacterized protein n=1 Tax=Batrachochytrium salamandrivorans TaxID=1357716 RepID=A0ABQ8FEC1_9FUNG|nr:hypothetical protein BASA60_011196 [Batrachochytrium salamandrivorans]KAH6596861.1 hypothetical protein BASA50_004855 [Batrachochytrium salamandrivorans]KAH6602052.1 hypothetical protein BASA61_001518 [Batrachochytrium salamandrivorans]